MLSIILIVVIAWTFYKNAGSNGKNGFRWALIGIVGFVTAQIIGITIFALLIALINSLSNKNINFESYRDVVSLFANVSSLIFVQIISAYLHRVPKDESYQKPPPPPTSFS